MDTPVTRIRLIASYLFMIASAGSVIILGQQDTDDADSTGFTSRAYIAIIDAEANSDAYDTGSGTDDPDPDPQPPPVEKPKDTLFAAKRRENATRTAATNAAGSWQLNIASYTKPGVANDMVERLRAAGFNAAHQTIERDNQQFWRVYITGFPSRQNATDQAPKIAARLGLTDYWISKTNGARLD